MAGVTSVEDVDTGPEDKCNAEYYAQGYGGAVKPVAATIVFFANTQNLRVFIIRRVMKRILDTLNHLAWSARRKPTE